MVNIAEGMSIPESLQKKIAIIKTLFEGKKVVIAFSGGVDSTLLAYLAKLFADEVQLVLKVGISNNASEIEFAKTQAKQLQLDLRIIKYNVTDESHNFAKNDAMRCYYCKQVLFSQLEQVKKAKSFDMIADGTNHSDLGGHRPGIKAAKEYDVLSPLAMAGLEKKEIRELAGIYNLSAAEKPSMACFATRIITGIPISEERIQRINNAEAAVRKVLPDLRILRVRDHGSMARIEVGQNELHLVADQGIMSMLAQSLRKLGFQYVVLDLDGYRPAVPQQEEM